MDNFIVINAFRQILWKGNCIGMRVGNKKWLICCEDNSTIPYLAEAYFTKAQETDTYVVADILLYPKSTGSAETVEFSWRTIDMPLKYDFCPQKSVSCDFVK